jgi:UDP-N-acetylglucosamine 2-epimerase (non-hydrolysing)
VRPITHVVGARPNFMKAAPVHAALAARGATQRLVHTGQHYDEKLSDVFFVQLGMPEPDANLGVGSGSHSTQTAALLTALEQEVGDHPPAVVVVYGDVNSTLAAALVCAKEQIPLVHVEAGLRSFDRTMPEEVNRVLTDAVADLLLVTSPEAYAHLADEGVPADRVRFVGNPMIDTLVGNRDRFDTAAVRADLDLQGPYAAATLHRPGNVDDPGAAAALVAALTEVASRLPVVLPLHPRGRDSFRAAGLMDVEGLRVVDPLGYLEFMGLVAGAAVVLTDSGGVQEETTILGVPCLTLRPNTERPITITHGTNRLVTPATLVAAVDEVLATGVDVPDPPPLWDGEAGRRIAAEVLALLD